jgi:hypothetical protein
MLLNALKSSSLIIAAARGVRATPNAQPATATPEIKEDIFMINFLVDLVSSVCLKIFEDYLCLRRGKIGPHPHVEHDGLPLGSREFGGVALRMAARAIDGVQLGAGEFLWRRLLVGFFVRFGVRQNRAEAYGNQRQGAGQHNPSFVYKF